MSGLYRDGEEAIRQRLVVLGDQREAIVARRRDLEAEQAEIEREIAVTMKRLGTPRRSSKAYLVAVVATGALASGVAAVTWLHTCMYPHSKIDVALIGAGVVRQAAELYLNVDAETPACPTLDELVATRKIDRKKTDDPWGRPYRIACDDGMVEIHAWSAGKDGRHGTADDIADHFRPSDVARVAALD